MMKISSLMILLAFISSCDRDPVGVSSPKSPGDKLPDPTATLIASKTSLRYGGEYITLSWSTHNATRASISPNLGAVSLSGDTTIMVRSTTTFVLAASNGKTSDSVGVTIMVSLRFEFVYPLDTTNQWTYRYHFAYGEWTPRESAVSYEIWGTHIWSIKSRASTDSEQTYTLNDVRFDTLVEGGNVWPSLQNQEFSIQVTTESIHLTWPDRPPRIFWYIPRFPSVPSDTLWIPSAEPYSDHAKYVNNIGLVHYSTFFISANFRKFESLDLIDTSLHH